VVGGALEVLDAELGLAGEGEVAGEVVLDVGVVVVAAQRGQVEDDGPGKVAAGAVAIAEVPELVVGGVVKEEIGHRDVAAADGLLGRERLGGGGGRRGGADGEGEDGQRGEGGEGLER
jgi:hypothetical protein